MRSISINVSWLVLALVAAMTAGAAVAALVVRWRMRSVVQYGSTDLVTMVCNLAEFRRHLQREVSRAMLHSTNLTMVLLDLDGLHEVNERHGYAGGDQLLRTFAQFLRSQVPASDVVARYRQGDEFVILAPNTSAGMAGQLVERLQAEAAQLVAGTAEDGLALVPVSFHAGIASFDPKVDTAETFQVKAELSLARARKQRSHGQPPNHRQAPRPPQP